MTTHTNDFILRMTESYPREPIDKYIPNITGCCFLPDDGVIVCDFDNKTLKLLEMELKIKFTILCQTSPLDVARFDGDSVVVLFSDNSFQRIRVKPGINLLIYLCRHLIRPVGLC